MEEITECLYTDGNDLAEKEIGNKKKKICNKKEISGVVCLSV